MAMARSSFHLCKLELEFIAGVSYLISSFSSDDRLAIFEIYPQSEIPLLTEIGHIVLFSEAREKVAHVLPDTVIFRHDVDDRIVFRIVDYRTNYSTSFSTDSEDDINKIGSVKVFFVPSKTLNLASNYYLSDIRDKDNYHRLL